jgi:hypothetical protein
VRRWVVRTLLLIFVGLPVLGLGSCAYVQHSPHLRLDRLNVALMDAPRDPERGWRTIDVGLVPEHFQVGQDDRSVFARLESVGYTLFADYSTDVGPRDLYPDDGMPQEQLDKLFAEAKAWHNEQGISHIWSRSGRAWFACGESLFVEVGIREHALTQASGYSRYTCL